MLTCVLYGQMLSHWRKLSAGLCQHTGANQLEKSKASGLRVARSVCARVYSVVFDVDTTTGSVAVVRQYPCVEDSCDNN
jgi:hypothetical protein